MENVEFSEEKELTLNFEDFLLVYNFTHDEWYIEYLEEDEDDFLTLNSIYDIIGKDIKEHKFNEDDVKKFIKLVELEKEE